MTSVEQAGVSEAAYTADEMMTVSAARALRDGMTCFVGIGLPSAAANLARATHAPSLVLIYESGTIGAKPGRLPLSIGDGMLAETADAVVSVPEICDTIGRAITTLLPYDQCRIYLLEDDARTLRPVYFSDTKRAEYEGVTAETLAIQVGEGITGWVAETKQGALVGDTERHPKAIHIPGTTETNESMLAVPVIFEDRLIGVIVNVKVGINQYAGDHLRLLTILANHAAVSIFNARLIERLAASARTDPLTGLANRRAFEQALEQRLAAAPPETFAVLMLDVDGLKQVNDARGHAAGDAVLKRVASVLSGGLRETDLATRWGGDEFLLVLPGVDQVGALSLARRIGGTLLSPDDSAGPISVSIGTAAFPADGTTTVSLLAAADRSMYLEKRQRVA